MQAPIQQPVLYRCPFCYFQTILENSMLEHFVFHSTKSAHQCPLCSFSSGTATELHSHVQHHHLLEDLRGVHGPVEIQANNQPPGGKNTLLKPAIFKCGQCDYIAKAKQTLQVHEFHHKEKSQFQCGVCSYSVTSARVLSLHVKHHHSGQETAPVSIEKVKTDTLLLPTGRVHLKSEKVKKWKVESYQAPKGIDGRYQAPRSSDAFYSAMTTKPNKKTLNVKKLERSASFKEKAASLSKRTKLTCASCEYSTFEHGNMKRHKMAHEREEEFKCSRCTFSSPSQRVIAAHSKRYHRELKSTLSETLGGATLRRAASLKKEYGPCKPFKYVCSECEYSTLEWSNMKRHKMSHETEEKFKCGRCSYSSPLKRIIVAHSNHYHRKLKPEISADESKVCAAEKEMKKLLSKKIDVKKKIEDMEVKKLRAEAALGKLTDDCDHPNEKIQRLKEKIEIRVKKLKNLLREEMQLDVEIKKAELFLIRASQ